MEPFGFRAEPGFLCFEGVTPWAPFARRLMRLLIHILIPDLIPVTG